MDSPKKTLQEAPESHKPSQVSGASSPQTPRSYHVTMNSNTRNSPEPSQVSSTATISPPNPEVNNFDLASESGTPVRPDYLTIMRAYSNSFEASKASSDSTNSPPSESETILPAQGKRIAKSYGSLTTDSEKLAHVKLFIKKTIKEEKTDRLERKELDKAAIAKMRRGVDEFDEILGTMQRVSSIQRQCSLSKPLQHEPGHDDDDDDKKETGEVVIGKENVGGGEFEVQELSREELDIISLRRQLANMRRRS